MPNVDREELAWAAGFFDGEGNIRVAQQYKSNKDNTKGNRRPFLSIAQTNKSPLERFQKAVFGLGKIYGPYHNKGTNNKPYWVYYSTTFENCQAVAAAIFQFLSPPKRIQVLGALRKYQETRLSERALKKEFCKRGHDYSDSYLSKDGYRTCRPCRRIRRELKEGK